MRLIPVLAWGAAAVALYLQWPAGSELWRAVLLYFVVQAVIAASAL